MTFSTNNNGALNFDIISSPQTSLVLSTKPTFYRFVIQAPPHTEYAVVFIPFTLSSPDSRIFMDGLVLVPGEHSDVPPHFTDPDGTQGVWGGQKFQNVIRNGSAEQDNLRFRPWARERLSKLSVSLFDTPFILSTLLDRHGISWYYRETFSGLFRTFWTSLAADRTDRTVPVASSSYGLMLLTFLGIVGTLPWIWQRRRTLRWDILFFLGLSLVISGAVVVFRGMSSFEIGLPIISWARYADPAIFPIALILCAGWLELLNLIKIRWMFSDIKSDAIFLGGMFGVSILAMVDAIQVIHPDWWGNWASLVFLLIVQVLAVRFLIREKARLNS